MSPVTHQSRYPERMPIDLRRLTIDRYSTHPIYRQLADQIRALIDDGQLGPGEALPGEQKIADELHMSRDAVRNALESLAAEALIVRQHGQPTRVAERHPVRHVDAGRYARELELLRQDGDHPLESAFTAEHGIKWDEYEVDVEVAREKATARDAELLGVKVGSGILRRTFRKRVAGEPVQLQRSAIPWSIAGGTDLADPGRQPWPGGTIAELYSLGLEVTRVVEDVEARLPRDDERRRLHMQTPGPVLTVTRVFWVGDRPVEASRVIVDAARYVLRFESDLTS
jgi:GntR family transcriptional regulator